MSESDTPGEASKTFNAYFGTTLENFFACAEVDAQGNVVFAKSREPRHVEPQATQFVEGLSGGASIAYRRAKELGHVPLILEGELNRKKYFSRRELLSGEAFPVKQVWIPKDGVSWEGYKRHEDNRDPEQTETRRVFEARNPIDILQSRKSTLSTSE